MTAREIMSSAKSKGDEKKEPASTGTVAPPNNAAREEFLTTRQLSNVLQVSEATIRRLTRAGRIPVIRLTARLSRYHLPAVCAALNDTPKNLARSKRASAEDSQLSFIDLL